MAASTSYRTYIDEIDVYRLTGEQRADFRHEYLGFVFQQHQLIPYLTAVENVLLPLAISKRSQEQHAMAVTALEKVGLGGKLNRLPSQLSGGEQGRVAIARAIVNRPPIVLADEPTGALDTRTGEEVMQLDIHQVRSRLFGQGNRDRGDRGTFCVAWGRHSLERNKDRERRSATRRFILLVARLIAEGLQCGPA